MDGLTYMAVFVQCVVGEFEFLEGDGLLQQLVAAKRRVWMQIEASG